MNFDWALSLARIVKAVAGSLPISGAGGVVSGDWSVTGWAMGAAALSALVVDVDSFIKAREARRLSGMDIEEAARTGTPERKSEAPNVPPVPNEG